MRVNQNFRVARQMNYKSMAIKDLGSMHVRFSRRKASFNREIYGPIRPR